MSSALHAPERHIISGVEWQNILPKYRWADCKDWHTLIAVASSLKAAHEVTTFLLTEGYAFSSYCLDGQALEIQYNLPQNELGTYVRVHYTSIPEQPFLWQIMVRPGVDQPWEQFTPEVFKSMLGHDHSLMCQARARYGQSQVTVRPTLVW